MSNPKDYIVGWICATSMEWVAAPAFLDETHEDPEYASPNGNAHYKLGRLGKHNVVIAVLPQGEHGISSAAVVATQMLNSFPNIRIGLLVGIGGGAPSPRHDIRLGDVVVSTPCRGSGGVFQYDSGITMQDGSFRPIGFLNQPPMVLQTAVNALRAHYESDGHCLEEAINSILERKPRLRKKYERPDSSWDELYRSEYIHDSYNDSVCAGICDPANLIPRRKRTEEEDNPAIHYGLIASGSQVMKDASVRDRLVAQMDVLCFDTEAAGVMNHFPCLVIRGICSYSDSHNNKIWQGYAAMTAAAYAKDLLCHISLHRVVSERSIGDILLTDFSGYVSTGALTR
jgi:nucleoside phosphorylase